MELLTSEAPAQEAIALVPEFGHWRHSHVDYAVFFVDDDGRIRSCGSELITELGGLEVEESPWAAVADSGDPIVATIDELAPEFAERARAHNITHVWGVPVADPLHDTHAVVAFVRLDGGADTEVHGYALDVMAKMLQLILLWRHQVISLRRAARLDPLTGVANRAGFWDVLEALESNTDGDGSRVLGVLYVDLDGFKAVNDQHGHSVGDLVLAEVARRLSHVVRPGDLIARIGGDEFAIVADGVTSDDDAEAIAERIVKSLCEPYDVAGHTLSLGASVGAATVTSGDFDPDRLLDEADRALYRAKADGRGRWHLVTGGTAP
jgi:diguanylate cyclase (GGDEF)-like protein